MRTVNNGTRSIASWANANWSDTRSWGIAGRSQRPTINFSRVRDKMGATEIGRKSEKNVWIRVSLNGNDDSIEPLARNGAHAQCAVVDVGDYLCQFI
jgi:hypothetical protein